MAKANMVFSCKNDTAADDRYIVLQHLGNRRLTEATTGRQYSYTDCQKSVETKRSTDREYLPYFGQILTRRHRTTGGIGADVTCTSDVLNGI